MKQPLTLLLLALPLCAAAQNPIIRDQFTADPTARVFNGKVYLYPSHDIVPPEAYPRKDWFCMEDYHVFSSENLTDWTDHGMIVSQTQVPWGKPDGYSMWAPDCVCKDGRYYFYFPDAPREGRGFAIGVATASRPEGPFTCEPDPIKGVMGIDPCVLSLPPSPIPEASSPTRSLSEGRGSHEAYIYWSGMGGIRGARLKDNMKELEGESTVMEGLPEGFKEGPFAFKRGSWYYLTFPWVRKEGGTETLAYAMSKSPLGPWDFKGVFMEEHANGCWTNHHSFVEYKGQWYLFYHNNHFSPRDDKRRSVCIEPFTFNADGTIPLIAETQQGVANPRTFDRQYFQPVEKGAKAARPTLDGFIHRWLLLEPIRQDIRSNTIFTDTWLEQTFGQEYFKDQLSVIPRDGQKTKAGKQTLRWHALDSRTYNVRLFRFAEKWGQQTYGSLFWAVTVIDCPEELPNVRLAAGSNGASKWWLNGEEVLLLSGDRRMVVDDGMSARLTLKKGRNVLRCAVINGPGLSDMCVRFLDEQGRPVTQYTVL